MRHSSLCTVAFAIYFSLIPTRLYEPPSVRTGTYKRFRVIAVDDCKKRHIMILDKQGFAVEGFYTDPNKPCEIKLNAPKGHDLESCVTEQALKEAYDNTKIQVP